MNKTFMMAVLSAIALVTSPAYANVSASASLTDLTVTLYSLNPTLTPSITFTNGAASTYSSIAVSSFQQDVNSINISDVNLTTSTANSNANAIISGTNGGATLPSTVSASGSANSNGTGNSFYSIAETGINNIGISAFTLSADAVAVFTANGNAQVASTKGGINDFAQTGAYLTVFGTNGNNTQNGFDFVIADTSPHSMPYSINNSGQMSLSFINGSNGIYTGNFSAQAFAYGNSAAPVPEPTESALMLSGIAMLSFSASRKKSA